MGCCCFCRSRMRVQAAPQNTASQQQGSQGSQGGSTQPQNKQTGPVQSLSVAPQNPGSEKMSSYDKLDVYYVVVGLGPAAAINLSTLSQSSFGKKRMKGYPVMMIGYPNPWPQYLLHGMGQPPYLLSMPGFETQPYAGNPAPVDSGFASASFGKAMDAELDRLYKLYEDRASAKMGMVLWIQSSPKDEPAGDYWTLLTAEVTSGTEKSGTDIKKDMEKELSKDFAKQARYRVFALVNPDNVKDQELQVFYADFVDICTGSGRPQVVAPYHADVQKARTPPWVFPEAWSDERKARRVLNGIDAIREEMKWVNKERVCVTAGGGIALNVAEKARNQECRLDWFARDGLYQKTFSLNPRNDTYLMHPNKDEPMKYGERAQYNVDSEEKLFPPFPYLRMGSKATLGSLDVQGQTIKVHLQGDKSSKIRDKWRKAVELNGDAWDVSSDYKGWAELEAPAVLANPNDYARLVIPTGLQANTFGQPCFYVHHLLTGQQGKLKGNPAAFTIEAAPLGSTNFIEREGRMLGLKSTDADGYIRVLGAAAHNYPGIPVAFDWDDTKDTADTSPRMEMWRYRFQLAASAVVDGFILAGINIAHANGFFDDGKPNLNINTMSKQEITQRGIADEIRTGRRANNGYENLGHMNKVLNKNLASVAFKFNYEGK